MKLETILSAVCESFVDLSVEDVWSYLVVIRGRRSFGDSEPGFAYDPGKVPVPLDREMELPDQFLLFEEIGHYPISCLFALESRAALEQALLSDGGYLNAFTTRAACVIDGRIAPFQVFYRAPDGTERRFDKAEQLSLSDPFDTEYPDARLAWCEASV